MLLEIATCDPVVMEVSLSVRAMFTHEFVGTAPTGELLRLDRALDGALSRLRSDGIFRGTLGETLILASPRPPVRAGAVLMIGAGDPEDWSPLALRSVVSLAAAEAVRLEKDTVAFSPSLADSGLPSFGSDRVAHPMMAGLLETLSVVRGRIPERWTFCTDMSDFQSDADGLRSAFRSFSGGGPARAG